MDVVEGNSRRSTMALRMGIEAVASAVFSVEEFRDVDDDSRPGCPGNN
jgi:hypothetical protein